LCTALDERAAGDTAAARTGGAPDSEAMLAAVLDSIGEGVVVADPEGRLLLANPAARELLGIEHPGASAAEILRGYEADTITRLQDHDQPLKRAIRGEAVTDEDIYHRPPGTARGRFLSVNARPLIDAAGAVAGGVLTFRDVTERRRVEDELAHLSLHDALTGLPNRTFFLENLDKAIARARRGRSRLALLLLDLDHFKQTNDRLGHDVGDRLLVEVARRLASGLRAGDFVGRLGGDEFVVLFENFGHDEHAASLASKIVDVLAPPIGIDGHEVVVSASIGISTFPECGDDSASLMKTADVAMYRAKESGRRTYHFYSRSIHAEISRRARLEADLKAAIVGDQFELEFQPIADLRTGRITGLEALLRWIHPEHGWVRPLEFVPILEATGMMSRVGEWVLASACSELGEWQRMLNRPDLGIAVNVSARQLVHRRILDIVQRVLTNANLDPSLLTIEITEAELLAQPRETRQQLTLLSRLGVRVALDDFGTGYASLQAIRQLPLTYLKIDRSLVMSVPTDPEDVAVIDAGIRFAEDLGVQIIAEGLEVEEQLRFLAGRGCTLGQGHLISAPLPAASVGAFLGRDWRAA
jgi:diguanylate cyclase (GGDEF)-like protein/PAS domain S-box-containing protein